MKNCLYIKPDKTIEIWKKSHFKSFYKEHFCNLNKQKYTIITPLTFLDMHKKCVEREESSNEKNWGYWGHTIIFFL
jgi:hypothetical protein